jgi:hypothetical protein
MNVRPIPEGTMEAPGFIISIFDDSAWMTKDGRVTTEWKERGVWGTYEEAEKAMKEFTKEME